LDSYTDEIEQRGRDLEAGRFQGDLDEATRVFLMDRRDLQVLYAQIIAFEDKSWDPEELLPQARERLSLIPNVYYMRVGAYYAYFERDAAKRSVTEVIVTRKSDH
jgi:hypothetical protein